MFAIPEPGARQRGPSKTDEAFGEERNMSGQRKIRTCVTCTLTGLSRTPTTVVGLMAPLAGTGVVVRPVTVGIASG